MRELLSQAVALHQAGQLGSAAPLYEQLLAQDPDNADALHLLGVLHHQQGDHARAIEEIGRAVVLRPSVAAFHANLAEVYRARRQFERAAGCCRMALRLKPDSCEALGNLGLALQGLGRHHEAVEQFSQACELQPESAVAHNNLGGALRQLNRLDEAWEQFRRAVELAPDDAAALTNLSQILVDLDRAEEALPYSREAVRVQPDLAALHHNLGNTLRALGQLPEAKAAYLEALRLDPNLAKSHAHLGGLLQAEGQLEDALTWIKQATELDPDDAEHWEALAELHGEREEPVEALACWRRAVALAPARAAAHDGLGWALQEEGLEAEAIAEYRTALRLQPDRAVARLRWGGLAEEQGDLAEAEAAYREALRLQPAYALPHARLATLLRGRLPEADRAALEQRLADPELAAGVRARLLFAQAQVCDARGEYAAAAKCSREANALSLKVARDRHRDYRPQEHQRWVTELLAAFGRDFCDGQGGSGLDTRRPVFVFGLPRSGTTLLEQILASHGEVFGAGELRLARDSFEAVPAALGRAERTLDCVAQLNPTALRQLAQQHEARLSALSGAARIVDKMPDNYLYLGLLAAMFPQATFIHCRRDLRDVAVSCWMTDFRSIPWAHDPEHVASRFGEYGRLMEHWRATLRVPIHEVDYETAVSDLEGTARRLVAACGLEWDPACLEFHRTQRSIRTASLVQVRQPLYRQAVGRWKNYEPFLAELFAALPLPDPRSGGVQAIGQK